MKTPETPSSPPIRSEIQTHLPMVESVVKLFFPYVEAAVHDLLSGKIVMLYNNFSNRQVGDKSPLYELDVPVGKFPDIFEPYAKTNWDGRILKCTSVTVRDASGVPIALICFNFDTSRLGDLHASLGQLLQIKPTTRNPVDEFGEDWRGHVTSAINHYTEPRNLILDKLTREEKKELLHELYQRGIFNYKNAAVLVARMLHISRTSVYNYLKAEEK